NAEDAARTRIADGELAVIENDRGRMIARARVAPDVQAGQVFAPMHWNAVYTRLGRVNTLVARNVDPVSRQPELKHGAGRVVRYARAGHGSVLSREPFELVECAYIARAKLRACWRTELAFDTGPASWPERARELLGEDGDWIELSDPGGRRYR